MSFHELLAVAFYKMLESSDTVYITNDEKGDWLIVGDGDEESPDILLAVETNGTYKLVNNMRVINKTCEITEEWRQ